MPPSPLPPPHPSPHAPRRPPPANACDAHCHIFGPASRFPYQGERSYEPAETPLERYEALQAALGLSRAVFVQPTVYGTDHAAIAEALERGGGRSAAVGIIDTTVSQVELARLHELGMRGARFNYFGQGQGRPSHDAVRGVLDRVARFGWHLVFHLDAASLVEEVHFLAELPCPVVIDHMGRLDAANGVDQPAFRTLLELARRSHVFVKVSGADRMVGNADLQDAAPFMQALAAAAPERLLWGTDWPHPNVKRMPDDGDLLDLLEEVTPERGAREMIFVANPARLYNFH